MKRLAIISAAAAFAAIPFAGPASADHACDSTVVDGAGTVYVAVDNPENEHGGVWIYAESNGDPGLQRNDDSCNTDENADTIIF